MESLLLEFIGRPFTNSASRKGNPPLHKSHPFKPPKPKQWPMPVSFSPVTEFLVVSVVVLQRGGGKVQLLRLADIRARRGAQETAPD